MNEIFLIKILVCEIRGIIAINVGLCASTEFSLEFLYSCWKLCISAFLKEERRERE